MKTFLEYVAADLLLKYGTDLSRIAVVFPNKRASLFLNDHLAHLAGKPLWSPSYITISDLFRQYSDRQVADPIKLVCDLHKSYTECTGSDETLDHFYGWGQLLVADFDDVDKNMAPADRVFANLRDIHELDDTSYLSENQKEILRRFFSNFNEDHTTELKQRFLRLWSRIGEIYNHFNDRLAAQGLAYEGALYREVAEKQHLEFDYDHYIFVGFNLLQQVEQQLFKRLKEQGKARFYWDFDHYYLGKNEAGHFIAQYLQDFPNELDNQLEDIYANFAKPKQVTFISASTENIQARYISDWLREDKRYQDNRKTAVVLANESLLQTVIHCLPDEVEQVNVTTGYPLTQTPVASLVTQLISLQTLGYDSKRETFRLRYINPILQHPYARHISASHRQLHVHLNEHKIYYPSHDLLCQDEGLTLLFTHTDNLTAWLCSIIRHIASAVHQQTAQSVSPLDQESLFRMYTLLNRFNDLIHSGDLVIDVITLQRLITQVVASTSIPFHGEPAQGIQVMGVLETRNLDFKHVLLLSCNEGNIPKGINDTSFIPYSIRKAYGLTTVDHKVAIYAYYFHRLLQRAEDITLVYNNSTNEGQRGEMSRFMLQMMVESGQTIKIQTLQAGQQSVLQMPHAISKTESVMQLLRQRFDSRLHSMPASQTSPLLTPTAINRYLRCQLIFYYYYVGGLAEEDKNDEDTIDNRTFGNIFHQAAHHLYSQLTGQGSLVRKEDLERLLKEKVDIERAVDNAFKSELFKIQDPSRPLPPFDGLQLINREVIIKYIRILLEIDIRLTPFRILGLEHPVAATYQSDSITTTIGGTIDRLDRITDSNGLERIRVIDYKTGSKRLKSLAGVNDIFSQEAIKDHSDYYLQTFLYSQIVRRQSEDVAVSPALLFIQHTSADNYDPTLCLGKEPVTDIATVADDYMHLLGETIEEIFNPHQPFVPTEDRNRCRTCPYAALCGL